MIRTLLIDDVQLARERLKRCLGEEAGVEVVGECDNGERAVAAVRGLRPDLVFLDVQMPALDGFGVLEALGHDERPPAVIFVTAYNEYAIQAFEVNALDYLLKPVDCKRLHKAVERARAQAARAAAGDFDKRFRALIGDIKTPPKYLKRLTIRQTGHTILLPTDEIDWVETYGNYLKVHAGRESHLIRGTMQQLEAKLDPEKFVRVHRSAIVNVEKVKEIHPRTNGDQDLVLHNGSGLMLSRNYRDKFLSLLGDL